MIRFNALDATFKMGINKFSDISDEELEARHNGIVMP
jgi:hypothetical protein